jgi:hypothetical protein
LLEPRAHVETALIAHDLAGLVDAKAFQPNYAHQQFPPNAKGGPFGGPPVSTVACALAPVGSVKPGLGSRHVAQRVS